MSSFDYTAKRETAKRLIEKFGAAGSFTIPGTSGGFDPNTGDTLPGQEDEIINGIVTPVLQFKQNEIDGKTIQASDGYVFFYFETDTDVDGWFEFYFNPLTGDPRIIGALHEQNRKTYRAVNIMDLISVDGVQVYCKVQLRTGG